MQACSACGASNVADARFCSACGVPLASDPGTLTRKTVTILYSDLAGFTALGERLDPEPLHEVMARYFTAMRAAIDRHGGRVEKYIGDAIMAVFGVPHLHEDDALRAARCALEMRAALTALNRELESVWGVTLHARYGLSTGEVAFARVGAHPFFALGDAVNVAQRLESAAPADEVLINRQTARLLGGIARLQQLDPLTLKGKSEPVPAWRLVELLPADEAAGNAPPARMVGTRPGAGRPARDAGRRAGRAALPSGHRSRTRGRRQVLPGAPLPRRRRGVGHHRLRSLPLLRRGHHLLAAGCGRRAARRTDRRVRDRRLPRRRRGGTDGPPRGLRSRSGSTRRRADRGDPAGVAPRPGGSGAPASARRGRRGHPLGRAHPHRRSRARRLTRPRRPAAPGLPGASRAADPPTQLALRPTPSASPRCPSGSPSTCSSSSIRPWHTMPTSARVCSPPQRATRSSSSRWWP